MGVSKAKKTLIVAFLVITAAVSFVFYRDMAAKDTRVKASGTVEVTQVELSPLSGGRILTLYIKEGSYIKKGEMVADLSFDGADNEVQMAQAGLLAAEEQLRKLENGFRREDIAAAKAELSLRRLEHEQALRDAKRFGTLAEQGVVSLREAELYKENANAKQNIVKMSEAALNLLQNGARPEEKAAAKAEVARAKAALARASVALSYKKFKSPTDGVILAKNYEEGDVIGAGASIATLGKMDDCWIKIYIPSTQLGLVKIGQEAQVTVDSHKDKIFSAKITEINQTAEYNPRLSLTQDERANMVFWIKIKVENKEGILKPGMPADVVIL